MRRLFAWLGAAMLFLTPAAALAQVQSTVKPYIVFIVDNSGSMRNPTGFGPPSCTGATDTKMDHAKCAIQNISNSYGDMVMALARYQMQSTDTVCADGCAFDSVDCDNCDTGSGAGCNQDMRSPDEFQLLVPLVENSQASIVNWNDFACGQCTITGAEPELFAATATPIAGSLFGARRYWQGLDTRVTGAGARPIHDDPLNNVFTSPGQQCRPYVTVLLTDGSETCADFDPVTTTAAHDLLTTPVAFGGGVNRTYRVEMKPIGFGIPPGDAEIEALAHQGGVDDDMNNTTHEGAYAQNEEELQVEISQIIADALKFEQCNDLDDDCDTRIDEDFPSKGSACDDGELGVCRDVGTLVCNGAHTGVECNVVDSDPPPTTNDGCNGQDDDCDGRVDENCTGCIPDVELCNGRDDDCDNVIDENLTRACGTDIGECTPGIETCRVGGNNGQGQWENCTATGPRDETCNRLDDDCDTSTDEDVPGAGDSCTGTNICRGTRACVNGEMVCRGDAPASEVCNNVDDDCDGRTDEGTLGQPCPLGCFPGRLECRGGRPECVPTGGSPGDEVCNGRDDDCDGLIDEGTSTDEPCTGTNICNGHRRCVNGSQQCVGTTPGTEVCDCNDNDCDMKTDEQPPALCPEGATCTSCQCAFPCGEGEFPCPVGRYCDRTGGEPGVCLLDPCFNVTCPAGPNGELQECTGDGDCTPVCNDASRCRAGEICVPTTGECKPDNCIGFPDRCTAQEVCVAGTCVANPCAGVECAPNQNCVEGTCVGTCVGVTCPDGQRCSRGVCETDPCGHQCPSNQVCNPANGMCVGCNTCPQGQVCDGMGGCKQDPCAGTTCPGTGQVCRDGTCYDQSIFTPDAGPDAPPPEYVAPGGGGGCSAGGGEAGAALGLRVVSLAFARRRRERRAEVAS